MLTLIANQDLTREVNVLAIEPVLVELFLPPITDVLLEPPLAPKEPLNSSEEDRQVKRLGQVVISPRARIPATRLPYDPAP